MMQSIKGPLQPAPEGPQSTSLALNGLDWSNNESVLCIAVGYLKDDFKLPSTDVQLPTQPAEVYPQYDNNMEMLGSQMDSITQYNPLYNSTSTKFPTQQNGLVVKHILPNDGMENKNITEHHDPAEISPNDFLQMVDTSNSVVQNIHMVSSQEGHGQDVDILITDQATGISYLVERCLGDSPLMDTDVLLDSDLLALDENVLKSQLSENIVGPGLEQESIKAIPNKEYTTSCSDFAEQDKDIVEAVQQICDQPIQTRARATLPVSHLVINQNKRGDDSVFAKKFVPSRTKFGPIEGVLRTDEIKNEQDKVHLSIHVNGTLQQLDVSNENLANWMCFVQMATKHSEQNLLLFQQDDHLYFLTTKNINPKQELLVGYSPGYAQRRNLCILEPEVDEDELWPCYECPKKFLTSKDFQKHLKKHDENIPSTKKVVSAVKHNESTQTNMHKFASTERKQDAKYKCPKCCKGFPTTERIQKHMMVHGDDSKKPIKCDKCHKRFLNNSALSCHMKTHMDGVKIFECPICKESFQHILELKTHVPKHSIDGKYTCPHCSKIFMKYSIIRKHIRAFHCDKVHECPDCDKAFPTLDKLRMHTLKHSDHREFLCSDCGKQFKRKDKLREHCKKIHKEDGEEKLDRKVKQEPLDYHRFIYKCHACLLGFKRRGMLVNHLAKRHPEVSPETVPELNLPIYRITTDYYCNYCEKIYKSSSKRKAHILKNHPGLALPLGHRAADTSVKSMDLPNPTFSQTVGSFTTRPQACCWCHRQYASKAKLLQHQRKKHLELLDLEKQNFAQRKANRCDGEVSLLTEVCNVAGQDDGYYQLISLANGGNQLEDGPNEDMGTAERLYGLVNIDSGLVPPR